MALDPYLLIKHHINLSYYKSDSKYFTKHLSYLKGVRAHLKPDTSLNLSQHLIQQYTWHTIRGLGHIVSRTPLEYDLCIVEYVYKSLNTLFQTNHQL